MLALFPRHGHHGHADVGQAIGHARVEHLAPALHLAGDVDAAGAGGDPARAVGEVGRVVLVFPGADAGLADVVHAGPDEIADEGGVFLGQLPESVGVGAEGLRAEDDAPRVFDKVLGIAADAVVVAGHVHLREGVARFDVAAVQRGAELHERGPGEAGEVVVELAAGGVFHVGTLGGLLGLGVAVNAKTHRKEEIEEYVDAAGDLAGVVEAVHEARHLSGEFDAARLRGLRHFVADAVHDDRGVVVVLVHQVGKVLPPPALEIVHVVVARLVDVPHVHVLVHQQHALFVAGFQQGLGAGVVRRADGVVAGLFEQAHPPPFSEGVGDGAEQAVVVVDAGAAQDHALSVEAEALFHRTFQRAHAEDDVHLVALKERAADVERGRLRRPERGAGHGHGEDEAAVARAPGAVEHPFLALFADLHRHLTGDAGLHGDLHLRADVVRGADAHAVEGDVLLGEDVEVHRPVDARARVPAAVGLLGVAGEHAQAVLAFDERGGEVDVEIRVAIGPLGDLFAVEVDFGVAVHALELQQGAAARREGRAVYGAVFVGKGLFVGVVAAFEPADVRAAAAGGGALFREHGVVRQGHGALVRLLSHLAEEPPGVERILLQTCPSPSVAS